MYEELEPNYDEKVPREHYDELKEEFEEEHKKVLGLQDDLDDANNRIKELETLKTLIIETILEYGNKYEFIEAYPKLIEYLKGEKLI